MFDPLSLLAGAGILAGGYGAGRVGRLRRHPKPPEPIEPICGCGHHRSFHEDGGACNNLCLCQRYVGPEPAPSFYAPELGG